MEKYEIEELNSNLQDYLSWHGIRTDTFFNCINPNHRDDTPSMKYYDDNKVYCFGCRATYNLIDVISIIEGLSKKEAFKKAIGYYFKHKDKSHISNAIKQTTNKTKKGEKDYSRAYAYWQKAFSKSEEGKQYLAKRGISEHTAKRFGIGFNTFHIKDKTMNSVIIPISKNFYTARNIDENSDFRYLKTGGVQSELFNKEALTNDMPYCFITEGEFDCLSFEEIGVNAIGLGSACNIKKFYDIDKSDKIFVLALDNDERGIETTLELENYFVENNYKYLVFDNNGEKDANKALVMDRDRFTKSVNNIINAITKKRKREFEM